ncbi:GH92 family glycosyl hydrolase [Helcococcus kunzii]|uniref:GH92 family glycosyl hydrolase n=1 Tax=Helcococcus kunzii TaxID=40091 RepID=UPI0021A2891D|nr:GH92 family glycosyl hydrolase [Helcococcus kunzii]MCT1796831.1 GH92 family glycosyl hydrolase [Helcococcus kunzii]MCT1988389.1 GH92 family glycosyl hydrolase [Helcococcus kunzii]
MNNKFLEQFRKYKFTDTRIGTDSIYEFSNGNTLPMTGVPFGLNYVAVQTNKEGGSWWFNPNHLKFEGFRITHQPSPWMGDYSSFTILPSKDESTKERKYNFVDSKFLPHYNEIYFEDGEIALVTASVDSVVVKYEVDKPKYILEGKQLHLDTEDGLISGKVVNFSGSEDENFTMYIVISSEKHSLKKLEKDRYVIEGSKELYVSTSFISLEQAKLNHSRMNKDFEETLQDSASKWQKYFDKFDVENVNPASEYDQYEPYDRLEQERMFYHAVYRAFLFPMRFYEIDENGKDVYYDTLSKSVKEGKMFTNMGMWDLHKTLFPLFSLIDQEIFEDILEGYVNQFRNSGYLPKWLSPDERGLMPGTLVDNVIAEASSKNIGEKYMEELLEAMIKGAEIPSGKNTYGRAGTEAYRKHGYVTSDIHESVNQTLDNCLSDWSIAKVAENLGKKDIAEKYYSYTQNYKNIFDKETGFMRAKSKDGQFDKDFDPLNWGSPYTEGSAYQNSYNVYHDVEGLIGEFGGKEEFEKKLDEISNSKSEYKFGAYGYEIHEMREFGMANFGHHAISNQPSFHMPYLYNFVDKPKKAQIILKELLLNYFRYDFKGFPGDEDNGSTSAWYIFSSLGFYPFCPGSNEYQLGIPFWNKATITLFNGNKINIKVNENYHHKKFIIDKKINGEKFEATKLTWDQIKDGIDLEFTLGIV